MVSELTKFILITSIPLTALANNSEDVASNGSNEVIEVVGQRKKILESTGSAHLIDEDKLKQYRYSDINRILQTVPGVYLQEEDGFGLRPNIGLRGAHPHRSRKVVILEDGELIGPAPYAAPAAYYFPNTANIQSIEVFKGPATIPYGPNNVGGAVNLLTAELPLDNQANMEVSAGSYDLFRSKFTTGLRQNDASLILTMSQIESSGFKTLENGGNTGFKKRSILAKTGYESSFAGAEHELIAKFGYSDEVSHETYLGLTDKDFQQDAFQRYAASQLDKMQWSHKQFMLRDTMDFGSTLLTATIYHNRFFRNWTKFDRFGNDQVSARDILLNPTGTNVTYLELLKGLRDSESPTGFDAIWLSNNERSYVSEGVALQFSTDVYRTANHSQSLHLGLRFHRDQIERDHTTDSYQMRSKTLIRDVTPRQLTTANTDRGEAISGWARYEITTPQWLIRPGVRTEFVQLNRNDESTANEDRERHDTIVAPGIGIGYRLSAQQLLIAGAYEGFTLPSPGESEEIKSEQSYNYEIGWRYYPLPLQIELIGFLSDYKNILGTCSFSSGCSADNLDRNFSGGQALIYGFEGILANRFSLGNGSYVPVSLNYTWNQAQFTDTVASSNPEWGVGTIQKGDPLPYIPRYQISLAVAWQNAQWELASTTKFTGKAVDQAIAQDQRTIAAHQVSDLSATYFFTNWELFAKVDNVTDEVYVVSYRPFGARPGKARSFELGVGAKL